MKGPDETDEMKDEERTLQVRTLLIPSVYEVAQDQTAHVGPSVHLSSILVARNCPHLV